MITAAIVLALVGALVAYLVHLGKALARSDVLEASAHENENTLSDVAKTDDFERHVRLDPDDAERLRQALNNRP